MENPLHELPRPLPHDFSKSEMEVLTALIDALVPPVKEFVPPELAASVDIDEAAAERAMQKLPDSIAGIMTQRLKPKALKDVRGALALMNTPFGSFFLAGRVSRGKPFAKLSSEKRELFMKSLASSPSSLKRGLFKALKSFVCVAFSGMYDENGVNPFHVALQYGPPPAPSTRPSTNGSPIMDDHTSAGDASENGKVDPVREAVVDIGRLGSDLAQQLRSRFGFDASYGDGVKGPLQELEALVGPLPELRGKFDQVTLVKCDAVVIGSGCGGSVLAALLSEAGVGLGKKVLVLEKGRYYSAEDFSQMEVPSMTELYDNGGFIATEDGSMAIAAGSCVGGGSVVNWSASFRTPPHVRREWAEKYGLKAMTTAEFDQATDTVCQRVGVNADLTTFNFHNTIMREGCKKLGWNVENIPQNAPAPHDCGWCNFGCKMGSAGKQSTPVTYLFDAVKKGTAVMTSAKAERVLFSNSGPGKASGREKHAAGVLVSFDNGQPNSKEQKWVVVQSPLVIVSCNALQTPPLLLRSGLKNKNIGAHLRCHPIAPVGGYFPDSDASLCELIPGTCPMNKGLMTTVSKHVANWETTGYGALMETPCVHPGAAAAVMPWRGKKDWGRTFQRLRRTGFLIAVMRDQGKGKVYLDKDGLMAVKYDFDLKKDLPTLEAGLAAGLRILRAAGAHEVMTYHWARSLKFDCTQSHSDADFNDFLAKVKKAGAKKNDYPFYAAHPQASCPMGVSPSVSVADENGETWEAAGLFLADGSLFPTSSGVNPMMTIYALTYMLGARLAKRFSGGEFNRK